MGGAERPVRAAVRGEEDERVRAACAPTRVVPAVAYARASSTSAAVPLALSFAPALSPLLSRWATTTMPRRVCPRRPTARLRSSTSSDAGNVLAPRVLAHREPVERELVAEPLRGARGARRARDAIRVVARQLGRQGRRGRAVEGRRKRGRGQRPGPHDGENREQEQGTPGAPRGCGRDAGRRAARPSRAAASACSCRGGRAPCRGL